MTSDAAKVARRVSRVMHDGEASTAVYDSHQAYLMDCVFLAAHYIAEHRSAIEAVSLSASGEGALMAVVDGNSSPK